MPIVLTLGLIGAIMAGLMIEISAALFSIIGGGLLFGSPFDPVVMKIISRLSVDRIDNFLLLAVLFFILAGRLMNSGGVTVRLFDFIAALFSRFRDGLAHANVLASFVFAGMSGSATADVVGLGAIEMKAMREKGYDEGFSAGVTAASSILGPILPPSIVLIDYSVQAEQSVATMLLAAVGPGVLLAGLFMAYVGVVT
ncbi:Sialic acid TRAP transporter permease protein SiaT (plasmid) [Sulfitobacter indolifex]|nr:TRAP transporter large permease subunit [Sulfitobacter indolifex]UOA21244.1 Sialic acid TRAP transporter permease protein SiaT [Sulfitobacter indolifex]